MAARAGITIIRYHHGPDDLGRSAFTLEWWQRGGMFFDAGGRVLPDVNEGIKGQCFMADPAPHIARFRARGNDVIEIDERNR